MAGNHLEQHGRISITEAARVFGISTNTIRRRVKKGQITPFQRSLHGERPRYVFDISDLVRVFGEPEAIVGDIKLAPHKGDSDMPRHVPNLKESEIKEVLEAAASLESLRKDHDVLKAKFEAQSRHLQDLQMLLTPRLTHSDPIGHRAARYFGEIARAFKGDKN
ncbi:MAG: helix-turn-helix domain-containing protein [Proteobacteria bacterium]|nr:helix-turn-helix domain-containing protein [Pseudomonadota bacterium]|tara:strand:- start:62 stop:553 length:492 start_codon:yes stop_codon:yes gene_type:complete